jgi:hypothetical protein
MQVHIYIITETISDLKELDFSPQISEKISNIKLHDISRRGRRIAANTKTNMMNLKS